VRRGADNRAVASTLDITGVENGDTPEADIPLGPMDVVYVPRSMIADVNVFVEQYIRNNIPFQSLGLGLGTAF